MGGALYVCVPLQGEMIFPSTSTSVNTSHQYITHESHSVVLLMRLFDDVDQLHPETLRNVVLSVHLHAANIKFGNALLEAHDRC